MQKRGRVRQNQTPKRSPEHEIVLDIEIVQSPGARIGIAEAVECCSPVAIVVPALSLSLVPSSRWYVEEVLPYLMNGIITSAIELSADVGGVNFSTGDGVGGLNCNENCGCGHGCFASARYVPAAQGFSEAALVRKTLSRAVVLKGYPAIPKTDD